MIINNFIKIKITIYNKIKIHQKIMRNRLSIQKNKFKITKKLINLY